LGKYWKNETQTMKCLNQHFYMIIRKISKTNDNKYHSNKSIEKICETNNYKKIQYKILKQEGHEGPEVAHLNIGPQCETNFTHHL
jgi:dsRNA-specific ribonuclease